MLERMGLRLRVLLFFLGLGLGGAAAVGAGAWLGYRQGGTPETASGFVTAGAVGIFGVLILSALVWLMFDEHVARPIQRLASSLRSRAHAGAGEIEPGIAKWLGDLAPAARAVSAELHRASGDTARAIADETARLEAERDRLSGILTQIPVAILLMSPDGRIVLYDGQSAELLGGAHPLCLNRPISDWLDAAQLAEAQAALRDSPTNRHTFRIADAEGARVFDATLRETGPGAGFMLALETAGSESLERPLVFDFGLAEKPAAERIHDMPLADLTFVVFDTETTGLNPERDDIVQIGAVRIVNGRLIEGETVDMLVNPGRRIPATSTRVHGITDAMVADAPDAATACRRFDRFARDSVLVAHNAVFDVSMLQKYGVAVFDHPVLDTVLLSAVLFGAEAEHTLDAIATRLGVEIPAETRHTALGDALATAQVLRRMLPMLRARGFETFGQVVDEMRRHTRLVPDLNHRPLEAANPGA